MKTGLLKSVIAETGMPQMKLENDLMELIVKNKINPNELTIDDLREITAEYLNVVFLKILEKEDSLKLNHD